METDKFEEIFKTLNEITDTFLVDIWIPSLNRSVTFKEISAEQQKEILESAMDNSIYNTQFNKIVHNIVTENSIEKDIKYTIFDKVAICVALKNQISEKFEVRDEKYNSVLDVVNLSTIVKAFEKKYKHPTPTQIVTDKLTIDIKIPTIADDIQSVDTEKTVEDVKNNEDVKSIVSGAFLNELSKYIGKLSAPNFSIDFSDISQTEKIKIVKKLPGQIIKKILTEFEVWKKDIDDIVTVKTKKGQHKITVNPIFFMN